MLRACNGNTSCYNTYKPLCKGNFKENNPFAPLKKPVPKLGITHK